MYTQHIALVIARDFAPSITGTAHQRALGYSLQRLDDSLRAIQEALASHTTT